jgi:hypothetical protein
MSTLHNFDSPSFSNTLSKIIIFILDVLPKYILIARKDLVIIQKLGKQQKTKYTRLDMFTAHFISKYTKVNRRGTV